MKNNEDKDENTPVPPYQEIREYIKNHKNTIKLVDEFKKTSVIYFSFIDSDTINFN